MKRVFAGAQNIEPTFEPICDYYIEPQTVTRRAFLCACLNTMIYSLCLTATAILASVPKARKACFYGIQGIFPSLI